jgi:hypothetical protein
MQQQTDVFIFILFFYIFFITKHQSINMKKDAPNNSHHVEDKPCELAPRAGVPAGAAQQRC